MWRLVVRLQAADSALIGLTVAPPMKRNRMVRHSPSSYYQSKSDEAASHHCRPACWQVGGPPPGTPPSASVCCKLGAAEAGTQPRRGLPPVVAQIYNYFMSCKPSAVAGGWYARTLHPTRSSHPPLIEHRWHTVSVRLPNFQWIQQ
jgi:hypothetical protein